MPQPSMPTMADAPVNLDNQTMDELFPAEPLSPPQAVSPVAQPSAPVAPQTPPGPDKPFLQAGSTVYKTQDAAVEGTKQKDALIEQLRQRYALTTGIDPITQRPVASTSQNVDNYATNPDAYVDALKAAKTNAELAGVQQKFLYDSLAPIVPAFQTTVKSQAQQQLKAAIPEFETFYASELYNKTLTEVPSLHEAIQTAENDPRFAQRLPDLYKTAYLVSKGIQLPELLQRQTATAQTPQTRPTNTASMPIPPEPTNASQLDLSTKEGRKAIIAQFESAGNARKPW